MTMVVTGATGFIGRHLVRLLVQEGYPVRALTRGEPPSDMVFPQVDWIVGDMADPASWARLLSPGCTVFNLAYSVSNVASNAVSTAREIVEACASSGISRLVHCSTVSVYGRVSDAVVTEATECQPRNAYGRTKLLIEKALVDTVAGRFESAILRPSNVFGDGGVALVKEIGDLVGGAALLSHLRTSLFGQRHAHFVPVETVASALLYLAQTPLNAQSEIFIISDDDEPVNNFIDVQRILREELSVPGLTLPLPILPRGFLEALLYMKGRANVNTRAVYSPAKILSRGFVRPVVFEQALRQYIRNYKFGQPPEGGK
ncbi:NAD-dependent epimerase/dehydratase family protein (plasmid) [Rhizobium sp. WL3]|uniref:NAD-dependent epimerase/dehydratase family protein n=1 Tax=Rhizobium sp. WL3 TaxID=2603277 RepID=UPI0011C1E809|nr:NAD-dependent epimerase/dehydratase family protein [Rhizobium sp. WL3]QEE43682.1 NAD-dependent epimerase/dehydratase family protein [Rhizobium sp. WL3]